VASLQWLSPAVLTASAPAIDITCEKCGLVYCLRRRVAIFRTATAPDSRGDDEDGPVLPESRQLIEVPERDSSTAPVGRNAEVLSNRRFPLEPSSEMVILFIEIAN